MSWEKLVGLAVGGGMQIAIYRRLGAPWWAAIGLADIAMRLELARTVRSQTSAPHNVGREDTA